MHDRFCIYTPPLSSVSSYLEVVDLAARYGITKLETLNLHELAAPDIAFAHELKEYADRKSISFPCVSLGIDLVGEDYTKALETAKKYVEIAATLGSPYFHHTVAFEFNNPQKIIANRELYYKRGICAVKELYDYADQYNIRTVCEDQGYLFNGVDNFARFLTDVERNVGVIADFGNIQFVDQSIEEFIAAFSHRIVHVHVKDYIVTKKARCAKQADEYLSLGGNYLQNCPIGRGDVNFEMAFRALRDIGYQGYISLECPPMGEDEEEIFCKNVEIINKYINTYL